MKALSIIGICLTSLILLAYPLVLMANLMTLAALPASQPAPTASDSTIYAYLWTSSLYPLPYLIALIASIWSLKKQQSKKAFFWQAGLFAYLVLAAALLLGA